MQNKKSLKKVLIIISFVILIVLISGTSYFFVKTKNEIFKFKQAEIDSQVVLGLPARLKVPSLSIDVSIEHVGLTSLGAMDVPKTPDNVAWFNLGPVPGSIGSAVIAGHSGWKNNIPAVFDNLHKLKIGDQLFIEDKNGGEIAFVVHEIRIYNQNDDALEIFFSNDGVSHLNLITCGGNWSEVEQKYSNRLVIFTNKVLK